MATNNPIGSQSPDDFKFNVANIDRAMNSDAATFTSREASDQPAREQFTWSEIQRRAVVEISAAEQAKIDAQAARDDAQAIAETLAAVKIYRTYALAVADLPNLQDGDNVEINQDETTDGLRTRYVVVAGDLADKTILSTVVNTTATPVVDTAAWEAVPVLESTPATIAAALNTVAQKLAKRTKWLKDAVAAFDISVLVQKTSPTGVAILPEGDDAERPAPEDIPESSAAVRGNSTSLTDYFLEVWNRRTEVWDALASRIWVIAKINELINAFVGHTIIYPNGGTAAAPANLSINTRLLDANPYPGAQVIVDAQVFYSGQWVSVAPAYGSSAGHGFKAFQLGDSIVTVSASTLLSAAVTLVPITGLSGNITTPLPVRVQVWKARGI